MRKSVTTFLVFGVCTIMAAGVWVEASQTRADSRAAQDQRARFRAQIPKTWDDAAMAALQVPLANPIGSPRNVSVDYYYRIPVRPIYKSYPVYAPGHEPPGYMDWLKQQDPAILWDDA